MLFRDGRFFVINAASSLEMLDPEILMLLLQKLFL